MSAGLWAACGQTEGMCNSPITVATGVKVPCGQCAACRFDKAREWAVRIVHELVYWPEAVFVTLTYDELVCSGSLEKAELQRFMKRLRENISPRKLKYYACGEYGDHGERPHYHAIIFGIGVDEHRLGGRVGSSFKCLAGPINDAWPYGFVSIGPAEWKSAMYVAQYVRKKLTGKEGKKAYFERGLEPPFSLVSQGLGVRYALEHEEDIRRNGFVSVQGTRMRVNRLYREKLGLTLADVPDSLREKHQEMRRKLWQRMGRRSPELGLRVDLFELDEGIAKEHNAERREARERQRNGLL